MKEIICFRCEHEVDIEEIINNWCDSCNKSFMEEKYE